MMSTFLLIEGVNLEATIYDTNQLSIIRGSSFLYKAAIETISTHSDFKAYLTPLSTGASVGLFKINEPAKAAELAKKIIIFINTHPDYCHLSLLVEYCEAANILTAKQRLQTQLRWRQLNALSQVPDREYLQRQFAKDQVSQLEGIRIASQNLSKTIQGNVRALSLSEWQRWKDGVSQRQYYYQDIATESDLAFKGELENYRFASTIEDLCQCKYYQQLDGKMAVIYIDGNGFGKHQKKYLEKAIEQGEDGTEAQIAFDIKIQRKRNDFLTQTLKDFLNHAYPDAVEGEVIRLETLLWGGDEMLFVVPAWLGFEFLQRFYLAAEKWELSDGEALTHAAGIVFCKAKTPIRIIQKLAKTLAERVKTDCSREKSAWDYIVLESVDYPTDMNLDQYFEKRYKSPLADLRPKGHFIKKDRWDNLKNELAELLKLTTAHQLFQLGEVLLTNGSAVSYPWQDLSLVADEQKTTPLTPQETQEQRLITVMPSEDRGKFIKLSQQVAAGLFSLEIHSSAQQRAWFWLHLVELWNYLIPKVTEEQEVQA